MVYKKFFYERERDIIRIIFQYLIYEFNGDKKIKNSVWLLINIVKVKKIFLKLQNHIK